MGVSCTVDSVAGKMGLVGEQNVTNRMGVRINPTAQFQSASHVRRFKMLNALDYYHVWSYMKAMVYAHKVNTREELFQ